MLFDTISRTDTEAAQRSETPFAYLNRTARLELAAVRELLERWFACYPATGQAELRAAFRSAENHQHVGAFFELFLHELPVGVGCAVELHPNPVPEIVLATSHDHPISANGTHATPLSPREAISLE